MSAERFQLSGQQIEAMIEADRDRREPSQQMLDILIMELHPKKPTLITVVAPNQSKLIAFRGHWKLGPEAPSWGPSGEAGTLCHGFNKWYALSICLANDGTFDIAFLIGYAGIPVNANAARPVFSWPARSRLEYNAR
jgi:hypothetical protein